MYTGILIYFFNNLQIKLRHLRSSNKKKRNLKREKETRKNGLNFCYNFHFVVVVALFPLFI